MEFDITHSIFYGCGKHLKQLEYKQEDFHLHTDNRDVSCCRLSKQKLAFSEGKIMVVWLLGPISEDRSYPEEWDKWLQHHNVVQSMTRRASDYTVGICHTDTYLTDRGVDKLLQNHNVLQSMTRRASDYTVGISHIDTYLTDRGVG
ncbi:hypothetical protein AVEN_104570-1 [Araneus ventricosus]|uniref:Uncharacterized protein n=1 Tax=Araneus ventricosus TaxID=182803 RepID=A0A4Y2TUP9_ARAVE|nr:hypothetical protein AVEN_104570-1 [Araneus ventricosus]